MHLVSIPGRAAIVTAVLLLGVLPAVAAETPGPTSIGFEDPGDLSNLLEYRLPDWGYKTWDLDFGFSGSGSDLYNSDESREVRNAISSMLGSDYYWYRESEARTREVGARVSGQYRRYRRGTSYQTLKTRDLQGALNLDGSWEEYLGGGPANVRASGSYTRSYVESIRDNTVDGETAETGFYNRGNNLYVSVGVGLGRARNVAPLIRAQRLSERLKAIGHAPLSPAEIQEVARVLATEHGYRAVYERPDRSFWQDVLMPMLDEGEALTPYEVFYLRDVMEEDVGTRRQGTILFVNATYDETREDAGGDDETLAVRRYAAAGVGWYRNLSLNHQLSAEGQLRLSTIDYQESRADYLAGKLALRHLWTILDRYRWDNAAYFTSDYREDERNETRAINREYRVDVESVFRIFIEDSMALRASVRATNEHDYLEYQYETANEDYRRAWSWSYGIGLEYQLDSLLF